MWQKIIFNFNRAAPSLLIYHAWPTFPRWKGHGYFWELLITPIVCKPLRSLVKKKIRFSLHSQFSHFLFNGSWGWVQSRDLPASTGLPKSSPAPSHLFSTELFFFKVQIHWEDERWTSSRVTGTPRLNATESPEDNRNGGRFDGPSKTESSAPPRSWDPPRTSW